MPSSTNARTSSRVTSALACSENRHAWAPCLAKHAACSILAAATTLSRPAPSEAKAIDAGMIPKKWR